MAVKVSDVRDIVKAIGGEDNLQSATHCVTRLRLVLNDDSKVDKEKLDQNPLVKGQFKADHQYQIVIGPGTVDEVYKVLINETGRNLVCRLLLEKKKNCLVICTSGHSFGMAGDKRKPSSVVRIPRIPSTLSPILVAAVPFHHLTCDLPNLMLSFPSLHFPKPYCSTFLFF
ncbi:PTS glucose/sucrose transporter subunit IIB, partial [Streptococcus suis]